MSKTSVHTVIRANRANKVLFRELLFYKDLLFFLVLKEIKGKYRQSVIGVAWAVIPPFFQMVIFSVIFGSFLNVSTGSDVPYPLFSYAALVPWSYFSRSFTGAASSLISNKALIGKVYFPRLIIPFSVAGATFLDFIISFAIMFLLMIWYGITPGLQALWCIPLVFLLLLTSMGMGLWLSAMAIQYRDVQHMGTLLAEILKYIAPVIFPYALILGKLGDGWAMTYSLYPMVGVIEGFRVALLGGEMPWQVIGNGSCSALFLFVTGLIYFNKKERIFADVA